MARSPELARALRVQVETAHTIRTAARKVAAPQALHTLLVRRSR